MLLWQVGKEFDALVVDVRAPSSAHPVFDVFQKDTFDVSMTWRRQYGSLEVWFILQSISLFQDILMKFLYLGKIYAPVALYQCFYTTFMK